MQPEARVGAGHRWRQLGAALAWGPVGGSPTSSGGEAAPGFLVWSVGVPQLIAHPSCLQPRV